MNITETRYHAQPFYPGSFLPEEGSAVRIAEDTDAAALAPFRDDQRWFCVEVHTAQWRRWVSGAEERWMLDRPGSVARRRIYVGELLTAGDVATLDGDYDILLANMRCNGWDAIVRTRRGNFQPINPGDVVYTPAELAKITQEA